MALLAIFAFDSVPQRPKAHFAFFNVFNSNVFNKSLNFLCEPTFEKKRKN